MIYRTAMQTRTAALGIVAGFILGASGAATAAVTMAGDDTPPQNPHWMTIPCTTADYFHLSNCYWSTNQGGGEGPAPYFVRTMPNQGLRCYFYAVPTADDRDHCVGSGVKDGREYRAR